MELGLVVTVIEIMLGADFALYCVIVQIMVWLGMNVVIMWWLSSIWPIISLSHSFSSLIPICFNLFTV